MNTKELKTALAELNVEVPAKATKADLELLLAENTPQTEATGSCKEVANFLYTRAGNAFSLSGGVKLKVSKLAVYNELMLSSEGACGLRATFEDGEFYLEAITE